MGVPACAVLYSAVWPKASCATLRVPCWSRARQPEAAHSCSLLRSCGDGGCRAICDLTRQPKSSYTPRLIGFGMEGHTFSSSRISKPYQKWDQMVPNRLYARDILSRNNKCLPLSFVRDRAPEFDNAIQYDGIDVYERHMCPSLALKFREQQAANVLVVLSAGLVLSAVLCFG